MVIYVTPNILLHNNTQQGIDYYSKIHHLNLYNADILYYKILYVVKHISILISAELISVKLNHYRTKCEYLNHK